MSVGFSGRLRMRWAAIILLILFNHGWAWHRLERHAEHILSDSEIVISEAISLSPVLFKLSQETATV